MKYYAVTDDPRELYHYGVKGMKWGQHIFGDKPKSPGYRKALGKLRSSAQKKIATIRNDVETRSDRKYQKQLAKAIKRSQISQQKYGWDQVRNAVKADEKAIRNAHKAELAEIKRGQYVNNANAKAAVATSKYERRAAKTAAKSAVKAAKAEKNFDKYLQAAREGRLKAGSLSDDQLQRINARLNAERQTRQMGGTEKARFRKRLGSAIGEGILTGVTRGIGAGMEEVAKAKVQNSIYNKHVLDKKNKNEAKRQKEANRIRNKKSHHEIDQEVKQKGYEAKVESGEYGIIRRNLPTTTASSAKLLQQRKAEADANKLRADIYAKALTGKNYDYKDVKARLDDTEKLRKLIYGTDKDPSKVKYDQISTYGKKKRNNRNITSSSYVSDYLHDRMIEAQKEKYDQPIAIPMGPGYRNRKTIGSFTRKPKRTNLYGIGLKG